MRRCKDVELKRRRTTGSLKSRYIGLPVGDRYSIVTMALIG